jgi:small subunit ribosomal protein S6
MTLNQYEAMFLFDPTYGSTFENCEAEIGRLMERANGEILFCRKWDERRLAYRINGRKRGVYVLVFFKAPPDRITPMERDAKLSEHILRLMVLRADGYTVEHMERAAEARGEESSSASEADANSSKAMPFAGGQVESIAVASEVAVAEQPSDEIASD